MFAPRRIAVFIAAMAICCIARGAFAPGAAAASLLVQSSPAGNAVLAQPPQEVSLTFNAPIDVSGSSLTIYSQDHKSVDTSGITIDGDNRLRASLPPLAKGTYAVIWSAKPANGNLETGAFGFEVDPAGASAKLVQQPQPASKLPPLAEVITTWVSFIAAMSFIGTMVLRFTAARAAVNDIDEPDERLRLGEATDRRLMLFGTIMLLLLVVAFSSQVVYEAGALAKAGWWQSFHWRDLSQYFAKPAGLQRERQLLIIMASAIVLVPFASLTFTRTVRYSARTAGAIMFLAMSGAIVEMLVGALPATEPSAAAGRAYFTALLDWGHLMSGSVWLGGLAALLMLATSLRSMTGRQTFWATLIRRFSLLATLSVAVTIPTGLFAFWLKVGNPLLLFSTLYGRTLLLKLTLVATLVAIGGFNQVWLLPRIEEARAAGRRLQSYGEVVLGHFRQAITIEVMIGAAILLVVPFLSGSARNQDFQAKAWDTTRTATAEGAQVKLRPGALQPGLTNYDVIADPRVSTVSLTFAAPDLGVPPMEVLADAEGAGHFRAIGVYTPMVGSWQVVAHLTSANQKVGDAAFTLPIRATPITSRAETPPIKTSTWAYGLAEIGTAWGLILAGSLLAKRISMRRIAASAIEG